MRKHIEYKQIEASGRGSNPLISSVWEAELGKDGHNIKWFARIKWLRDTNAVHSHGKDFLVLFDNDIEGYRDMVDEDDGTAYNSFTFHRDIYKYDCGYWGGLVKAYRGKYVEYKNIDSTVQEFITEHGIK